MLYQLFGVGALAHRGLPPVRGAGRDVPLAFPAPHYSAREGCPGHCGTLLYGTDFQQRVCYLLKTRGTGQQWLNSGSSPASCFPCQRLFANITFSYFLVRIDAIETLLEQRKRVCSSTVARVIAADTSFSPSRNSVLLIMALARKSQQARSQRLLPRTRSFIGELKLACKNDCVKDLIVSGKDS